MVDFPKQASVTDSLVLIDVRAVGAMLCCSWRTVYRLADAGKLPRPVKVGRLTRWRKDLIEAFILNGCKMTGLKAAD